MHNLPHAAYVENSVTTYACDCENGEEQCGDKFGASSPIYNDTELPFAIPSHVYEADHPNATSTQVLPLFLCHTVSKPSFTSL